MDAKELADILNGLSYKEMVPPDVAEKAKQGELVIVYGSESDTMEFKGALLSSIPCYEGCVVYLDKSGVIMNECVNEDCPYFLKKTKYAAMWVKGNWGEGPYYSWTYDASVPCERFDVIQDGEKYCRGLVFDLPFP